MRTQRPENYLWPGSGTVFPGDLDGKESACNVIDLGSVPRLGRSPGDGNGYLLHVLAWRIPRTEEPGRPQPMGSELDTNKRLTPYG